MSFNITEFVESPAYKKTMGKVYGIGAAVVILGALWKILHLPGASYMLIAGLGTEAVIFFMSAFEPPHAMPDWSLVYPELIGLESTHDRKSHGGGGGGGSELAALIQTGKLDSATVDKLSDGLKKLTQTTNQLSDLSNATMATENYMQNMRNASDSVSQLTAVQNKTAKTIQESSQGLSDAYSNVAKSINESGTSVANDISRSGKQLIQTMDDSRDSMASSYKSMADNLASNAQVISNGGKVYTEQLDGLGKNLASINSIYELQIRGLNNQLKSTEDLNKGIEDIRTQMFASVDDVRNYREQVGKLSSSISELNSIYGNMLSAMNINR